jgi:hypothetical protein
MDETVKREAGSDKARSLGGALDDLRLSICELEELVLFPSETLKEPTTDASGKVGGMIDFVQSLNKRLISVRIELSKLN